MVADEGGRDQIFNLAPPGLNAGRESDRRPEMQPRS
jgi:hypothetical protein